MKKKILAMLLILCMAVTALASCGECKHEKYTNGVCDTCGEKCTHSAGYADEKCKACGTACTHTYSNGTCSACGKVCTAHTYDSETGKCTICNKACAHAGVAAGSICGECGFRVSGGTVQAPDRTKNYAWTTPQTFVFQLNLATSEKELGDLTKRYMAGVDGENTAVDRAVLQRNGAAISKTKVTPNYAYVNDGTNGYGWGGYCHKISTIIKTHVDGESPDAFSGFAWDMTFAANLGNLTNLYTKNRGSGSYEGKNYFTFTEADYNPAVTGDEGYNFDFMRATSPVPDTHLYVYASNYNIDLIRAMYCIPVSLELLSTIDIADSTGDRDTDGDFDIDDFYAMISAGQFTYENFAILTSAVFDNTSGATTATLNDTLGFAISITMGLSSAGFAYSQPFEYVASTDGAIPTYTVDVENAELFAMYDEAEKFFTASGIGRFSDNEESKQVGVSGAGMGIRTRFSQDKILFGGVICVGALDYEQYQNMESGFGVAPLPTYKTSGTDITVYSTAIHNLARVIGLSKASTKFVQCSAYFDYQALNSTVVMNQYYRTLQYTTVGGRSYNVEMLNALRDNITENNRDQYVSMVAMYDYSQAYSEVATRDQVLDARWPEMFRSSNFSAADAKEKHKEIFAPALELAINAYAQKMATYEH